MDKSLQTLCSALNKLFGQLKPQSTPISFLLLTGKSGQGKSTLLRQTHLKHLAVDLENDANIFYNNHGVILEIGEEWINQCETPLPQTLKQLNRSHHSIKISGLLLCIDSGELLTIEPSQLFEHCKAHVQLLHRFAMALGYRADLGLIYTKLDTLAGFCEFFQSDHQNDLLKPLGFSIHHRANRSQFIEEFKHQFDAMLETLGQQIINKLHPARSTVKRSLIREFPLQLASLRVPTQAIIQSISPKLLQLQTVYFTSAEQGGVSVDRLNKKIQQEYALIVQDQFPQSNNYRAYFIEGAIRAFQKLTKYSAPGMSMKHKYIASGTVVSVTILLSVIAYQHVSASRLLDEASRELINYETLLMQKDNSSNALYHLSQAEAKLDSIQTSSLTSNIINDLKSQVHQSTRQHMAADFLPEVLGGLQETFMSSSESQFNRYQALKIYIMLGDPNYYVESQVTQWFKNYWHQKHPTESPEKQLILLKSALQQPMQPIAINWQLVRDVRNYLNALPATYLFYSLAKTSFPQEKQTIQMPGFNLAYKEIPIYYTRAGFNEVMALLPQVSQQLVQENWVLARQDIVNLQEQLENAYTTEYASWWQNFTQRTNPQHYHSYQEAHLLTQTLQTNRTIPGLIQFIQNETSPSPGADHYSQVFNAKIANQFTSINLLTASAIQKLNLTMAELDKFLTTIALVNDEGRTVFELTKSRFQNHNAVDPLSGLYSRVRQLPEPVSTWAKQIADDTWFMFINESKNYLNSQWTKQVYREYEATISHRFPFDPTEQREINVENFQQFFNPRGTLTQFFTGFIKPFLDTSEAQWKAKELNGYMIPISENIVNELIRANVITQMFFPQNAQNLKIEFSLQKIELDPVVSSLQLTIGETTLADNQTSDSFVSFNWPESDARLMLKAIDGNHYELEETGPWAFFKILQKVNVLVDEKDSSSLQILFEVNGNSGRYLLKTENAMNPFSPGILAGFNLVEKLA